MGFQHGLKKQEKWQSATHLAFRMCVAIYNEAVLSQTLRNSLNYSLETNPEAQTMSEECPLGRWDSW